MYSRAEVGSHPEVRRQDIYFRPAEGRAEDRNDKRRRGHGQEINGRHAINKQTVDKLIALFTLLLAATDINLAVPWAVEARNINNTTRTSVNRNTNVNRNVNVNRHVDVDVDVDRHYHNHYHDNYHPVATAAAVTAAAVTTAAVVGAVVRTLPPSCSAVVVNGLT